MTSENASMLRESVSRLFREQLDKEAIVAAENGEWLGELWATVDGNGLTRPHELDECGSAWVESGVIARAAGRYCVPLPVSETILASWLLAKAGIEIPDGPLTIASGGDLVFERVPWAARATHLVVAAPIESAIAIRLFSLDAAEIEAGTNLALEPRDRVRLDSAKQVAAAPTDLCLDVISLYGAMLRCGQMAGALDALLDMSVQYAAERIQFGKPLAAFQAIQQELAKLAGHVAEAGVAADAAFASAQRAAQTVHDPLFEIAAAKVVAGEAAELAPRIAHQVHGAIGFTYEHALHFASRRLWAWRAEFGTASVWAERLGRLAYECGADGLWPQITAR